MSTNEPPPPPPPTEPPAPPPPPPPPPPAPGAGGYSVGNAFSYGWAKFTQNLGQILLAIIILVAVLIAIQVVGFLIGRAVACDPSVNLTTGEKEDCSGIFTLQNVISWLFSLVGWIVSMIIGAGIVRGALDITEGRQLDPTTLLRPHRLGQVVIASLIVGILTFVGFILCIIPGILVAFFTSYTLYFLMDRQEMSATDAIKASFDFTKSNAGNVILWFLLSVAALFVGALLCGIGLIVAVPVVIIGTAYTYKTLTNEPVAP